MHKIDEKLLKENIQFDYARLRRMTIILVAVIWTLEFSLITYNLLLFQEFTLDSLYWICTGIPILLSTISKVKLERNSMSETFPSRILALTLLKGMVRCVGV